jgi:REP element-mobilizing transposase RayT
MYDRRTIRLPEYDYSLPGAYFITICTHGQKSLFGEIVDGVMQLNDFGSIVEIEWMKTPQIRHEIELGDFVIMHNHFHAIVIIHDHPVGAYGHTPLPEKFASPSRTIGALIRGFKGSVTKSINLFRHTPGQPVWQRNFYEHIIRNEQDMQMISEYIIANPAAGSTDLEIH